MEAREAVVEQADRGVSHFAVVLFSVEAAAPLLRQPRSAKRVRERVAGCCPVIRRASLPQSGWLALAGRLLFP